MMQPKPEEPKYFTNIRNLTDDARMKGPLSCTGDIVRCYKCKSYFHLMKDCSQYKPNVKLFK